MPSRAFLSATAVTRTMVSPNVTSAAPSACFAMRPTSMDSGRPKNCASTFLNITTSRAMSPKAANLQASGAVMGGKDAKGTTNRWLLPNPKPVDHALVAIEFGSLQVVQQAPPLPDELEQAAAGVVILAVNLEVFRQILDARAEQRDLHLGRARVRCVKLVLRKQLLRSFGSYPHLSSIFRRRHG